jgi:hypothetical protein
MSLRDQAFAPEFARLRKQANHQAEHKEHCERARQNPEPEGCLPSSSLAARFQKLHSPSDTPKGWYSTRKIERSRVLRNLAVR